MALAAASVALAWILNNSAFFQTLELKTVDYRFRLLPQQQSASPDIVIAEIDDFSIRHLEPAFGRWPWSREVHALFLRFMERAGAKVVAYDVLFTEKDISNPEGDEALVEQTRKSGNVVHIVYPGNQKDTGEPDAEILSSRSISLAGDFPDFVQADFPLAPLARASRAIGHVASALDADGPFRHYLLMVFYEGRALPALALATALVGRGLSIQDIELEGKTVQAGAIRAPLDENWRLPIWFNGGPGTYKSYGYSHVVYSEAQIEAGEEPIIDPGTFKDKIVLVGVTAAGLHDLFTTPYSGSAQDTAAAGDEVRLGKMAGVEVHANVVDNLLHNRYLFSMPPLLAWIIAAIVTTLGLLILFYVRLSMAWIGLAIIIGGYLALAQEFFSNHYKLPVVPVASSWGIALVLGFAYQYWVEGVEKRKVKTIFSRYVSRDVYQQLLSDPSAADLGGKRTLVTVLFSDLRGFTSMSENRPPEHIVAQLNEYFSAMVEIVFEHRGTIDKFVGDMIMALFNAPLPDSQHSDHALQCALAMQRRLKELNRDWKERGLPELACGVGINSGEMIAGNVGAETIRSYTVIGDNVNLGARLESLCKDYKADIIISEFTRKLLQDQYPVQELGEVTVKGKSRPVKIFQVTARDFD